MSAVTVGMEHSTPIRARAGRPTASPRRPGPGVRTDARGGARRLVVTPVGAVVRGFVAGVVGTAAMDVLLFARYRRGGGESEFAAREFSSSVGGGEESPAPAQVGRRVVEGLFGRELPPERAGLVNNVTHWGYGILGGVQYGIVAESLRTPRVRYGLAFGASVWAASYVVLPAAKLYKPIWEYDRVTLAKDLSAHLVYGVATATALRLLSGSNGARGHG